MILGSAKPSTWVRWFAWHPVTLQDGRVAWLEWIERRWTEVAWISLDFTGYASDVPGFVYRAPAA